MTRVVVTGASGFVGRFVVAALRARSADVALGLRPKAGAPSAPGTLRFDGASTDSELEAAARGASAVIHLAAVAHDVHGRAGTDEYFRVNRDYAVRMARAARSVGVGRFVFVSSIKVNGDATSALPFSEEAPVRPEGPYAESKWQAEQEIARLAGSMRVALVRPPLVYGPGVRANFLALLHAVHRRVPLPFAAVHNARSLIYVESLADALAHLALGPAPDNGGAPSSTYLVSDGEALSTAELVRRAARALGVEPRLFALPAGLLKVAFRAMGRPRLEQQLLGSLVVDSSRIARELHWRPPFSVDEGLRRTAAWLGGIA